MTTGWLWQVACSAESFSFKMSPLNCDNRELSLSDFALCVCEYEFQLD